MEYIGLWNIGYVCIAIYAWQALFDFWIERRAHPSWILLCIHPSYGMEKLAALANSIWRILGAAAAIVASFPDHIKLRFLYMPLWRMAKPAYELCTSVYYFFDSYLHTAQNVSSLDTVSVGSAVLIFAAWAIVAFCTSMFTETLIAGERIFIAIVATTLTYATISAIGLLAGWAHHFGSMLWPAAIVVVVTPPTPIDPSQVAAEVPAAADVKKANKKQ